MNKIFTGIFALIFCLMGLAMDEAPHESILMQDGVIINVAPFTPWSGQTSLSLTCKYINSAISTYRTLFPKEIAQFQNVPQQIVFCCSNNKFCSLECAEYQSKTGARLIIFDPFTLETRDVFLGDIAAQDKFAPHENGLCYTNKSGLGLIENEEEMLPKQLFAYNPNTVSKYYSLYRLNDFLVVDDGFHHKIFDIFSKSHKGLNIFDAYNIARNGNNIIFFGGGGYTFQASRLPNCAVPMIQTQQILCCVSSPEIMVTCLDYEEPSFNYLYAPFLTEEAPIGQTSLREHIETSINLKLPKDLIARRLFLKEKILLIFATDIDNMI